MPFDAVRKWTSCSKCDHSLCTCVTKHASLQRARNFIFQTVDSFCRNCADKDVLLKTTEQFCLMTIPITSTVHIQAQCEVKSGGELFCGNKREKRGVNTWLAPTDGRERGKKHSCNFLSCRGKKAVEKQRTAVFNFRNQNHRYRMEMKHRSKDGGVDESRTGEESVSSYC